MENTRTNNAVMGKILSGPSTSFLGEQKHQLFGTFLGNHIGTILDHIGSFLIILDLFRLCLGRGRPPGPPSDSQGVFPAGLFFPKNGRIFCLEMCFMCFLEKVSLGSGFFTNLPSFPPLQSNPLHFLFQSNPIHFHSADATLCGRQQVQRTTRMRPENDVNAMRIS